MKFGDVLGYTGLIAVVLFIVTVIAMLVIPPMLAIRSSSRWNVNVSSVI